MPAKKEFTYTVTETQRTEVTVTAENAETAISLAQEEYYSNPNKFLFEITDTTFEEL